MPRSHSRTASSLRPLTQASKTRIGLCGLLLGLGMTGCATVPEQAAIETFLQAVKEQDGQQLVSLSTTDFQQTALRHQQSPRDLKMLRIPEGEIEIAKVEDVSDDVKRVIVEVGESKRKVMYQLQRNPQTKKWLIDDVYLRQRRDGITITKSVTDQMDLLLTVREFADTWKKGERDDLISSVDTELSQLLSELPPTVLASIAAQVSDQDSGTAFRPEAVMRDDGAAVRIARRTGDLVLTMQSVDGQWNVTDLAIESREDGEHIKSLKTYSQLMLAGIEFLDAYKLNAKTRLASIAEPSFYEGSLLPGQLTSVPLPTRADLSNGFELKQSDERADFLITSSKDTVRLTLEMKPQTDASSKWIAHVSDVTIYKADHSQTMRLSSALTAVPVMQVFSQALRERSLEMLKMTSTIQLSQAIWDRCDQQVINVIPLMNLRMIEPEVISTSFHGDVTEVNTIQGDQSVTYVLRLVDGALYVDDVQLPESITGIVSLKSTLAYTVPIYQFALNWHQQKMTAQRQLASEDFSRRVLSQFQQQPELGFDLVSWMTLPLDRIDQQSGKQHLITLRSQTQKTEVVMIRQGENWTIDDIILTGQQFASHPFRLKQAMKMQVVQQFESSSIRPVAGLTQSPGLPQQSVVPAMHQQPMQAQQPIQTMGYDAPASQANPMTAPQYNTAMPKQTAQQPTSLTPDSRPMLLQEIPIQ